MIGAMNFVDLTASTSVAEDPCCVVDLCNDSTDEEDQESLFNQHIPCTNTASGHTARRTSSIVKLNFVGFVMAGTCVDLALSVQNL